MRILASKSKQEWKEAESKPYDGRFDKEWESMTTEEQWLEIKTYLDEWKSNPASNYSDKDRFFKQLFEYLFAQSQLQTRRETIEEVIRLVKYSLPSGMSNNGQPSQKDFLLDQLEGMK